MKHHGNLTLLALFLVASTAIAGAPTTLSDFTLPGSQPGESGTLEPISGCDCHSGYDIAVEPAFNWHGSMMSQAMRDPLFTATMVIANQDAPESGDLCIRCHTPKGWLEGRSTPTDGSALTADDREGVTCHFCHKSIKPQAVGVNPYPGDPAYTSGTYPADQDYFATMTAIPAHSANGMYVVDSLDIRRGPYVDEAAPHSVYYSPFHRDAALCGSCHDVSNPVYSKGAGGVYEPNAFDQPAPNASPYELFPVERTYSEWLMSAYNSASGVYAPQFGGNRDTVRTCQDCHLHDVTGKGCRQGSAPIRTDLGVHDMTGGNTFVPELIKQLFPDEVVAAALDSGVARAERMLQKAASLELTASPQGGGFLANVRVTNETGHKLPSGYPEGRRIWINVRAFNAADSLIYESGAYDTATGVLTHDVDVKIYEIKPGVGSNVATTVSVPAGPSFHFVLNNQVYSDNRIPPRGFTNAQFEAIQSPPVAYSYEDGQYWDDSPYPLPGSAARVRATLYYQTTSKEYIEFLRDENVTDAQGDDLYALWLSNGKSAPVAMVSDTIYLSPTGDSDLDGVPDSLDNCPAIANPGQEDIDDDGYGAACECDDGDPLINPATVWYGDADGDTYGDPAVTLTQCAQPGGYVLDSTDCDDVQFDVHPGAAEVCNGVDDNCSLTSDEGLGDGDLDGWGAACDNCPFTFNPGQADADSNDVGDACESGACPVVQTGDINESGNITSADVIYAVNYVFKAGPTPLPCEAAGDVNCDGVVTSGDIIYLVNYVFKGGAAPCDVCTMIPVTWSCP